MDLRKVILMPMDSDLVIPKETLKEKQMLKGFVKDFLMERHLGLLMD